MQSRPYDGQDGLKIWLSRAEREQLLRIVKSEESSRRLAFQLGLHGLRTEEIVNVTADDVCPLEGSTKHVLVVQTAKKQGKERREPPLSDDLANGLVRYRSDSGKGLYDPLIDKSKRRVREWIEEARVELAEQLDDEVALDLSMHDLRRTWATDVYYSLAFAGVPIAEQLTMSWGGWEQTSTGRETFRRDYLGPVPDHVTERAIEHLELV